MAENETPEDDATSDSDAPRPAGTDVFPEIGEGEGEGATVIENMVGGQLDGAEGGRNINAMLNVGLNVQIVLGHCRMPIAQLLELSRGSVIELDKKIGEPVEVVVNERLVARGDLVKVGEDRIGVTLTEIVKDYVSERR
ncbi:flagellar motor switch protein FliN [Tranquillimonas alkanivorans]|uniref:Flagellar motor switch protein FliN n=1 Tax=Tranquillimonas alkanivorans TaxID=441119 RepID=A0A1I5S5E4_9RHOB|nr:flagellar motor switch protein FliN [Tranquillimonas alkanivorans]SFP65446.1 flagellar motor switch protein FliN/FliY [Tranquillimonas alkanivorans]